MDFSGIVVTYRPGFISTTIFELDIESISWSTGRTFNFSWIFIVICVTISTSVSIFTWSSFVTYVINHDFMSFTLYTSCTSNIASLAPLSCWIIYTFDVFTFTSNFILFFIRVRTGLRIYLFTCVSFFVVNIIWLDTG
jgi:hypothetical protein